MGKMEFCPTLLEDHPWRRSRDPSSGILQYLTEALSPEDAPPGHSWAGDFLPGGQKDHDGDLEQVWAIVSLRSGGN